MLTAVQFPFTDARPFLQGDTNQLGIPTWPNVDPSRDFVRWVGPVRLRRKGATEDWPHDDAYCQVSRAFRIDPSYHRLDEPELAPLELRRYCAFRRFLADGRFTDGSVVTRFEIGFGFCPRGQKATPQALTANQVLACVRSSLNLSIGVRLNGTLHSSSLIGARDLFNKLYLLSTSKLKPARSTPVPPWWFRSGLPLVLVEISAQLAPSDLPPNARLVSALEPRGVTLAWVPMEVAGVPFGVWLIGLRAAMQDADLLRRLRINLFRLHAERQSVAEILRLVRQRKIEVVPQTAGTTNLQDYLRDSVALLNRETRDGLPQSEILTASRQAEDSVQPGERTKLLAELEKIRPNLLRSVQSFVDRGAGFSPGAGSAPIFVSYSHADRRLFNEFKTMLTPAIRDGLVDIWDDTRIRVGQEWKAEIEKALAAARVGVLLVSDAFLASEFIAKNELPPLLDAAKQRGGTIFWIPLSASMYEHTAIAKYQAAHDPAKPLDLLEKPQRKGAWAAIGNKLVVLVRSA